MSDETPAPPRRAVGDVVQFRNGHETDGGRFGVITADLGDGVYRVSVSVSATDDDLRPGYA